MAMTLLSGVVFSEQTMNPCADFADGNGIVSDR